MLTHYALEQLGNATSTDCKYEDLLPRGLQESHMLWLLPPPKPTAAVLSKVGCLGPQERAGDGGEEGRMTMCLGQSPQTPGSSIALGVLPHTLQALAACCPLVSWRQTIVWWHLSNHIQQANRGTSRHEIMPSKHDRATLQKLHTGQPQVRHFLNKCSQKVESIKQRRLEDSADNSHQVKELYSRVHSVERNAGQCTSWTTHADMISNDYHIQMWNIIRCVFKRKGAKGKQDGNFHWPSAMHLVPFIHYHIRPQIHPLRLVL